MADSMSNDNLGNPLTDLPTPSKCEELKKRVETNDNGWAFVATSEEEAETDTFGNILEVHSNKIISALSEIRECLSTQKYTDNSATHYYFQFNGDQKISIRKLNNLLVYWLTGMFPSGTTRHENVPKEYMNHYEKAGFEYIHIKSSGNQKEISIKRDEMKNKEPKEIAKILRNCHQIILQGPPGTGKTRVAKQVANLMIGNNTLVNNEPSAEIAPADKDKIKLIQFHPAYSYEDFVRGIVAKSTPNSAGTASIAYKVENKILAEMAQKAKEEYDNDKTPDKSEAKSYVLIIDEINRANLSSVLGELIYALEYRDEPVESMYAKEDGTRELVLPTNLFIIGTMNTADRSVGSMDYALRRRFTFIDVLPDESVVVADATKKRFEAVKKLFGEHTSPEFEMKDVQLGHSYFIGNDDDELDRKFKYQVMPILHEYVKDGVLIDKGDKNIKDVLKGLELDDQ